MRRALSISLGLALAFAAPGAFAQDTQPGGAAGASGSATVGAGMDTSATTQATPPPPAPEPAPAPAPAPAATTTTTTTTTHEEHDDGTTDHDKVVGHFGVGYMGLTSLPIAQGGGGGFGSTRASLDAPVIGARYWMSERLGLDLGLGFTLFSSSATAVNNNVENTVDGPAAFGMAFHVGVPLAFAKAKHYKFLVIPEANVGFTRRGEAQGTVNPPPDIVRSGFRLDAGARIGTEIQFGFIGVPQLALQATVGLNFRHQNWKSSQDAGNGVPTARSVSESESAVGTTVQSDPWALFVNNISAIYYFP